MSSVSSIPKVDGPASDSPCPRKSMPRTFAVPRRNGRVLDEVRRDRSRVAVEDEDRLVRIGYPVRVTGVGREPATGKPQTVT